MMRTIATKLQIKVRNRAVVEKHRDSLSLDFEIAGEELTKIIIQDRTVLQENAFKPEMIYRAAITIITAPNYFN